MDPNIAPTREVMDFKSETVKSETLYCTIICSYLNNSRVNKLPYSTENTALY